MIPTRKDVFGGTLEFCSQVMCSQRVLEKFGLSATGLIIVQYYSMRSHEKITSMALPIQVQMCCNMMLYRSESGYLVLLNCFLIFSPFLMLAGLLQDFKCSRRCCRGWSLGGAQGFDSSMTRSNFHTFSVWLQLVIRYSCYFVHFRRSLKLVRSKSVSDYVVCVLAVLALLKKPRPLGPAKFHALGRFFNFSLGRKVAIRNSCMALDQQGHCQRVR